MKYDGKLLRTNDPLSQPVIHFTLVLTCFVTIVFGGLHPENGLRFPRSRPLYFDEGTVVNVAFDPPGLGDYTKIVYWTLPDFIYAFNGTHYAVCKVVGGIFTNYCAPKQILRNPAAFVIRAFFNEEIMTLQKCERVEHNRYCIKTVKATINPHGPVCLRRGKPSPDLYYFAYDLKDDGTPLGLFSYGSFIYAFLKLTSDNSTISVTRACRIHWSRPPRNDNANYGAIVKLKDCAVNSNLPIFVNFLKNSNYLSIGYLDSDGSIHLCVHNLAKFTHQFDLIRDQCDKASKSLRVISSKDKIEKPCVPTDRPYRCDGYNFLNEIVYYDKVDTYEAEYFKFDKILVTPDNPIEFVYEYEIGSPFTKSTLLISQKNDFFIINGLEGFKHKINPVITHFNATLDFVDPYKHFVHLYKPNIFNSYTSHPIYTCESLTQQECILAPECIICGLECKTSQNIHCPTRKPIALNSVVDPLIMSNGFLEITFTPNGSILNINVTLEPHYNNLIQVNASYIPTTGRIKCKLDRLNDSIVFPFYRGINIFLKIDATTISQPSLIRTEYFEITDIVRLVDPKIKGVVGNSIMIDHPSEISFEFKRIATKHLDAVEVTLQNLTFICPNFFLTTFNCSLTFPSEIYWPGHFKIFVKDALIDSYPIQLSPYPIFFKTVWHSFPGYSVPFHFFGQYFYSFYKLVGHLKLNKNTNLIKLDCTIDSDTEINCKFDSFPAELPAVGNFILYSHSNRLTNLPNFTVNLNDPPSITSANYISEERTIKISTLNYFDDYIYNTSISVIQCYLNCSETQCSQIVFNSAQNILTCNFPNNFGGNSTEWLATVKIGSYRLNIVVAIQKNTENQEKQPKIISTLKFSIVTLSALVLLMILVLAVYYLRKEIDRLKLTSVYTKSTKSSNVTQKTSKQMSLLTRAHSATEFRPFDSQESAYNPEMLTNQFAFFTKRSYY